MAGTTLSPRLSPQAKRLVLRGDSEMVSAVAEVIPSAAEQVRQEIERRGGRTRGNPSETRLLTFEVAARELSAIADLGGVVFITTAEPYCR